MEECVEEEYCIVCGAPIPEGRQICPTCEDKYFGADKKKGEEDI